VNVLRAISIRSKPQIARALHIPGADRVVSGAGEKHPSIGADTKPDYLFGVSSQLFDLGSPFHIPQDYATATNEKRAPIWSQCERAHFFFARQGV
jgi:hypothetical protein